MTSRKRAAPGKHSTSSSSASRTMSAAASRPSSIASRPRRPRRKQAQSRVKALAKMKPIASQVEERVAPFILPSPEKMLASAAPAHRERHCRL